MRLTPRNAASARRPGAAVVEMALISMVFFGVLFGIFEYCRLLFTIHMATNAARDAARYAVVHTGGGTMAADPATISMADIESIAKTGKIGATTFGSGMMGFDASLGGFDVDVFAVDPAGLAQTPPVIQELPSSVWSDAAFGQKIAVRIKGTYKPIAAGLLLMPSTIPFRVTVMTGSEAN